MPIKIVYLRNSGSTPAIQAAELRDAGGIQLPAKDSGQSAAALARPRLVELVVGVPRRLARSLLCQAVSSPVAGRAAARRCGSAPEAALLAKRGRYLCLPAARSKACPSLGPRVGNG